MERLLRSVVCVLLLTPVVHATGTGRISEIGLGGFTRAGELTRVRIAVTNPSPSPQPITVSIKVGPKRNTALERTDTYTEKLELRGGEAREFDVPVVINSFTNALLKLEVRDAAGKIIGSDERDIDPPTGRVVEILCVDSTVCQKVEAAVRQGYNTQSGQQNNEPVTYVQSAELADVWWAYTAASEELVVARSLADASGVQRDAIEQFARQGGRVLLLDKEVAAPDFLAEYVEPQRRAGLQTHIVGIGRLLRVSSADDPMITAIPQEEEPAFRFNPARDDSLTVARRVLATTFRFPSVTWLLAWLVVYVIVVGVVNFAVLRRLRRLELGWLTIPGIALVFAVLLFVSSDAHRPRQAALDEVLLYSLDEHSGNADLRIGLRVSTPGHRQVRLIGPPNSAFEAKTSIPTVMTFWREMSGSGDELPGWNVDVGPPPQTELSLLQWSFQDVDFHTAARLPGTVHRVAPRHLRNDTGLDLKEAIFVEGNVSNMRDLTVYRLGHMAPGAEVDMDKAGHIWARDLFGSKQRDPLISIVRNLRASGTYISGGEFIGLSENADAGAKVVGGDYVHKGFAVVDVAFEDKP